MDDDKLIEAVADLWVSNGGDAEGIDWCYLKIKDAINRKLSEMIGGDNE